MDGRARNVTEAEHLVRLRRGVESIVDGPFGSNLASEHYVDEGARVIRLGNIGVMSFRDEDKAFIEIDHFQSLRRHVVIGGDLLVAGLGDERHAVGRACIAPMTLGPALVKADCFRLRPRPDVFDGRYLAWFLNSTDAEHQIAQESRGATRVRATPDAIASISAPTFELFVQRRIAHFLDDQVARIDKIIAARREQSALLVGAEESELEHVLWAGARGVALRRLGTTVTTGPFGTVFSAADFVDDGIPMINPTQLTAGRIVPDLKHSVSRDTASRLARHQLRGGDIITGRKGDIGRSAVIDDDQDGWVCGSDAIAIHPDRTCLLPRFLDLVLHLPRVRADLVSRSPGATMPSLNEGMLLSVEVPELSLPEQEGAEFIGSSIRGRYSEGRTALSRSVEKLDELKRSLITAAVTGEFDVSAADGSRVPVG